MQPSPLSQCLRSCQVMWITAVHGRVHQTSRSLNWYVPAICIYGSHVTPFIQSNIDLPYVQALISVCGLHLRKLTISLPFSSKFAAWGTYIHIMLRCYSDCWLTQFSLAVRIHWGCLCCPQLEPLLDARDIVYQALLEFPDNQ